MNCFSTRFVGTSSAAPQRRHRHYPQLEIPADFAAFPKPKGFKRVAGGRQAFEATSGISGKKKHPPLIGGGRQFALAAFEDELKTLLEKNG
jgi:hypothetical protein